MIINAFRIFYKAPQAMEYPIHYFKKYSLKLDLYDKNNLQIN